MDLSGTVQRMLPSENLTVESERIYYAVWSTIFCCDMYGKLLWKFQNEEVCASIAGIGSDSDENVYVAGNNTCNVVIVSPDGTNFKELLSESDQIKNPTSMSYD